MWLDTAAVAETHGWGEIEGYTAVLAVYAGDIRSHGKGPYQPV